MFPILTRGGCFVVAFWKRARKPLFWCLVGAGVTLGCLYGVFLYSRWLTGVIFPGTQFFYSSNSTKPRVFRLTLLHTRKTARVRIAPDYINSLIPGARGGYFDMEVDAFLPDLVPEQVYAARDKLAAKLDLDEPPEKKLKKLQISLEADGSDPRDPKSAQAFITEWTYYVPTHYHHLKNNPYPQYDAYIWGPQDEMVIDGGSDTQTYYIPKTNDRFYVHCSGEGGSEVDCSILFVYRSLIDVEIDVQPQHVADAAFVVRKVSAFLDAATRFRRG